MSKKSTKRYILKKTKLPGRGGGPKVDAWYVYDTETKMPASPESPVEFYAQRLCDSLNMNYTIGAIADVLESGKC